MRASGPPPLRYQWQRNGVNIAGATAQDYTLASPPPADNGARFRAVVTNDFGSALSNEAMLTVTSNQPPTATITQPAAGTLYSGGSVINYAGTGTDPEDGTLPASAFTWQVDFHHDTHSHPFIPPTSGVDERLVHDPDDGRDRGERLVPHPPDRPRLRRADAHDVQRDVLPRKVQPHARDQSRRPSAAARRPADRHAADVRRASSASCATLEAPAPQTSGGTTYEFVSWSDGGAASAQHLDAGGEHDLHRDVSRRAPAAPGNGLSATYYDNIDFTGHDRHARRSDGELRLGRGLAGARRSAPTRSARAGPVRSRPQFTGTYTFYTQSDDGVRLWVNGQQIINNWTDHAPTENSGTIALTAGQRYDIRMEFYENGGGAVARLLWSSASVPKAVVPSSAALSRTPPPPTSIRINFQPAAAPVPAGYLADGGLVYAARGNGQTYGWNADNTRADARSQRRQLARSALRHADAPAEAGESRRGLGDRRAERHLRRARRVRRREQLRQRVPDHGRGRADRQRHADDARRAGSRARRR